MSAQKVEGSPRESGEMPWNGEWEKHIPIDKIEKQRRVNRLPGILSTTFKIPFITLVRSLISGGYVALGQIFGLRSLQGPIVRTIYSPRGLGPSRPMLRLPGAMVQATKRPDSGPRKCSLGHLEATNKIKQGGQTARYQVVCPCIAQYHLFL